MRASGEAARLEVAAREGGVGRRLRRVKLEQPLDEREPRRRLCAPRLEGGERGGRVGDERRRRCRLGAELAEGCADASALVRRLRGRHSACVGRGVSAEASARC